MRNRLLLAGWYLSDALLFIVSYIIAYWLRVGMLDSSDYPLSGHLVATVIAAPIFLGALTTTRVYALGRNQRTLRNVSYLAYGCLVGLATFALTYYFLQKDLFSRLLLVQCFFVSLIVMTIWHLLYDCFRRYALRHPAPFFRALIVGVTRESSELIGTLNQRRNPITPVAILDGRGAKEDAIDGVPVLGKLNKLEEVLDAHQITHLVQCADLEQTLNLISVCRQRGLTYMMLPSVLGSVERDERVESLEGRPVTTVSPQRTWGWFF